MSRAALAALALAAAHAGEPPLPPPLPRIVHTAQASHAIRVEHPDPASLASAVLYITTDGGQTWRRAQELSVPGDGSVPAFPFVAPADGSYGFWTVAVARDGRRDAEPLPGMAPKLTIVVDRSPPALEQLDAVLGGVSEGRASIAVSWQVSDANLGADAVTIEASGDEGRSFAPVHQGERSGTTAISVPIAGREMLVRLVARDLAGNVLTSPARSVTIPAEALPRDPEAELAAAVAALPPPEQLGAGRSAPPIVSAAPVAVATPAPAATEDARAAPAPAAVPDTRAAPAAAAPAASAPAPGGAPISAAAASTTPQAVPGATAAPRPAPARPVSVDPALPFLSGAAASAALSDARRAEERGEVEAAHLQYLRLQRSTLAKAALEDHLLLLRRLGDDATILALVEALPPELRTDAARLHAAQASLRLGDAATAARWAASVRLRSEQAREATLVLARALRAQGRAQEARRLYDQLAAGDDVVAAQARAER